MLSASYAFDVECRYAECRYSECRGAVEINAWDGMTRPKND